MRLPSPMREAPVDDVRECVRAIALPERCAPCAFGAMEERMSAVADGWGLCNPLVLALIRLVIG